MNRVVIGVGSNIDPEENIAAAREMVAQEFRFLGASRLRRTAPIGTTDQPHFLNGAFLVETELDRGKLKERLLAIEARLGRVRTPDRSGPRTIDLDPVVFNDEIVDPDYDDRDFLRAAVQELLPRFPR